MIRGHAASPAEAAGGPRPFDQDGGAAIDPPRAPRLGPRLPRFIPLLAVALYLGTLGYDFVWDDFALVVHNQYIRHLAALPNWVTLTAEQASLGHFSGNIYRPGMLASLAMDFTLWRGHAAGFHLTNVLLHGVMVWLVYRLVRRLAGREELAILAALLFAVHPSHVEAVAWVSARADLWVSIWMIAGVTCYHGSLRRQGWGRIGLYGAALLSMAAGLLFKEAAAVFPLLLLLLESLGPSIGSPPSTWPRAMLRSLPFWALAVGHLSFLSRPLQTYNPDLLAVQPLLARLPGSLETLARYVGLLLFPVHMQPFYGLSRPTSVLLPWPLVGAGLAIGLLVLGIFTWRRLPLAAFGLGWFLITVAPYLDLLAISPRAMGLADRYLYGPSLGFLLLGATLLDAAAASLARKLGVGRTQLLGAFATILVLVYIGMTTWYLPVWEDNLSLYSQMVRDFPQASEPHLNLGTTYVVLGEADRGIAELEKAVQLRPQWVRPQITLALLTVELRNASDGFRLFDRIAPVATDEYLYYVARGRAHLLVGQSAAAAAILNAGLRRFPKSRDLCYLLGRAREAQGDAAGAIDAYGRALTLDPTFAFASEGMARAKAQHTRAPAIPARP